MNDKTNFTSPKVAPKGDGRPRRSKSVNLWVVNRSWSQDMSCVEVCGIIESTQPTVYRIEGKSGQWVRYANHYHPLHTADEFSELLTDEKMGKYDFSTMI